MFESIISLSVATALLLGSPGPAPLAIAATGATYGTRKGIPFLVGILCGLLFAIIGATLGIVVLLNSFPDVRFILQVVGGLYIVYIAQKIARAPVLSSSNETGPKPSLLDGFILNLINPKAYAAFLAIFSQFLLPLKTQFSSYLATGLVCFLVAVIVDSAWLALGAFLRPIFESPNSARAIRVIFAILMVGAVIFAFFIS